MNESKEKFAFMVTWVTHNSRVSERMIEFGVRRGEAVQLEIEDEIRIMSIVENISREDQLRIIETNICRDHVHMILVCGYEERDGIVRRLKGKSAYQYFRGNEGMGKGLKTLVGTEVPSPGATSDPTGGSTFRPSTDSCLNKGLQPLVAPSTPRCTPIEPQHLWVQKYHWRDIDTESYLRNCIEYIRTNREHHNLAKSPELEAIISRITVSVDDAFRQ